MTQRIFDIENEKDYADLWDILPEETNKIAFNDGIYYLYDKNDLCIAKIYSELIKINWHAKKEIIRPVDDESMIGCVCKFSTCPIRIGGYFVGILDKADNDVTHPFHMMGGGWFEYCEPAKKSELKFWEDEE